MTALTTGVKIAEPTSHARSLAPNARRTAPGGAPRILVAEDDAEMRILVTELLEGEGYDVTAVTNGVNLLTHVETILFGGWESGTIRLVICDDRLPGVRGLRILEGLRSLDPETPVILMTGFGDASVRARVEELGGIFLDKPFSHDALLETVKRLVPPPSRA